jgi:hypothetical protein
VADLLECMIQIKGLSETPGRLSRRIRELRASRPDPAASGAAVHAVAALAVAESSVQQCLTLMLSTDRPVLAAPVIAEPETVSLALPIDVWLDRFTAARRETVQLLARCTSQDLNRCALDPVRGPTSVADVVALLLAHDTDQVGRLVPPASAPPGAG